MTASLVLVVAYAEHRVIGADGGMPWHLPSDLRHFKQVTMGKPVIMGRKTFESIGRALPGRDNIVVTRDAEYTAAGACVAGDIDAAIRLARESACRDGQSEICVIGGGEIYRQTLELAARVYLTEVHLSVEGDTSFPELSVHEWTEVAREDHVAGDKDTADFSFVVLDRTGTAVANEA